MKKNLKIILLKKAHLFILINIYTFHKISSDEQNYELRCKDRNCKERAKYTLINKDIHITQECTLDEYDSHNYIKEIKIREKIVKNDIEPDEMKEYIYQKIYFEEKFKQYLRRHII